MFEMVEYLGLYTLGEGGMRMIASETRMVKTFCQGKIDTEQILSLTYSGVNESAIFTG